MGPQDGLDLLLDSVEYIVKTKNRRDVLFVFIGWGTEVPQLKTRSAANGLESAVKVTGRVPMAALAQPPSTADIGVAADPSNAMNDKSTMGKILEYMAIGLPVVH